MSSLASVQPIPVQEQIQSAWCTSLITQTRRGRRLEEAVSMRSWASRSLTDADCMLREVKEFESRLNNTKVSDVVNIKRIEVMFGALFTPI
jgi:hypothetical protein